MNVTTQWVQRNHSVGTPEPLTCGDVRASLSSSVLDLSDPHRTSDDRGDSAAAAQRPTPPVAVKAARLLTEGRVHVLTAAPGWSTTRVVGDHGTYTVTRRRGGWHCDCPAWGACSHLRAAQLVLGGAS